MTDWSDVFDSLFEDFDDVRIRTNDAGDFEVRCYKDGVLEAKESGAHLGLLLTQITEQT